MCGQGCRRGRLARSGRPACLGTLIVCPEHFCRCPSATGSNFLGPPPFGRTHSNPFQSSVSPCDRFHQTHNHPPQTRSQSWSASFGVFHCRKTCLCIRRTRRHLLDCDARISSQVRSDSAWILRRSFRRTRSRFLFFSSDLHSGKRSLHRLGSRNILDWSSR